MIWKIYSLLLFGCVFLEITSKSIDVEELVPASRECGFRRTMAWLECTPKLSEPCPTTCSSPDDCMYPYCNPERICECRKVLCKDDLMCRFYRIPCAGNFTCQDHNCICSQ